MGIIPQNRSDDLESKTDYGFIFIVGFAIAYLLTGLLKLYGYAFSGKIMLGCSICSVAFAITSILETFVTGYKQAEKSVISKITDKNQSNPQVYEMYKIMQENYMRKINWLHKLKSILLVIIMTVFFLIITTDYIEGNSTLADGLSLISFALIIFDIALKMYLEKIIVEFNYWAKQIKNGGQNG